AGWVAVVTGVVEVVVVAGWVAVVVVAGWVAVVVVAGWVAVVVVAGWVAVVVVAGCVVVGAVVVDGGTDTLVMAFGPSGVAIVSTYCAIVGSPRGGELLSALAARALRPATTSNRPMRRRRPRRARSVHWGMANDGSTIAALRISALPDPYSSLTGHIVWRR